MLISHLYLQCFNKTDGGRGGRKGRPVRPPSWIRPLCSLKTMALYPMNSSQIRSCPLTITKISENTPNYSKFTITLRCTKDARHGTSIALHWKPWMYEKCIVNTLGRGRTPCQFNILLTDKARARIAVTSFHVTPYRELKELTPHQTYKIWVTHQKTARVHNERRHRYAEALVRKEKIC
jgi:hypothetical protein